MVDVLDPPRWTAMQTLIEAQRLLPQDGDAVMMVYRTEDGRWGTIASSVTMGEMLVASELLRMRALESLE